MKSKRVAENNQKLVLCSILAVIVLVIVGSILFGSMKAQAASAEVSYKYYTSIQVQKGDTLWTIAKDYITDDYDDMNTYLSEIRSINHISDDNIHAGQYITVPYYSNEYLE